MLEGQTRLPVQTRRLTPAGPPGGMGGGQETGHLEGATSILSLGLTLALAQYPIRWLLGHNLGLLPCLV